MDLEAWKKWYINLVIDDARSFRETKYNNRKLQNVDYDDDIAIEVLTYRKSLVDFAESSVTRSPRPSKVAYRVGQVIRHKRFDLTGVIIGWDERAQAPQTWIDRNYGEDEVYNNKNKRMCKHVFY